mmetsp:Transcript_70774/g.114062  ORF Transcript_70774/g.114062 Transcript_70774/m.114062 type:complete len:689 (+) Transcript_70774:80-2146(+)
MSLLKQISAAVEDGMDPRLKIARTVSGNVAALTGQSQAVARAALDALGEDQDSACRLLLSGLALAVLDKSPCEVMKLEPGAPAWLSTLPEKEEGRPKVVAEGAFADCFFLRVERDRKESLRLFALEPVDVCFVTEHRTPILDGWSELEYTEPPVVESLSSSTFAQVQVRMFDPGPLEVPYGWSEATGSVFVLVRIIKKPAVVPPRNSLASRRPRRAPPPPAPAESCAKRHSPPSSSFPLAKRSYRTLELIGSGTFGKVFLAEEVPVSSETNGCEGEEANDSASQKRPVPDCQGPAVPGQSLVGGKEHQQLAVKQVSPEADHKSREVELLRRISHPCIVSLVDTYSDHREDGIPIFCIVMEYVPQNLHQKIGGQPLATTDLRCFSFQLFRALAYLDGIKVCHRDLKPENVLLQPANRSLKVADFGSAKILGDGPSTSYICSRWWRAPELVLGATHYATSVDWWSCGCIIAEMMLGRPLFTGQSSWSQMYEIVRALGTPTLEEVRSLHAGCESRMTGHLSRLSELGRPAKPWEELLPAFAGTPEALELPAALLAFDPSVRQHPAQSLRSPFFRALLTDSGPLPPGLFDFSAEELSTCSPEAQKELQSLAIKQKPVAEVSKITSEPGQNGKRPLEAETDDEPRAKRQRFEDTTTSAVGAPGAPEPLPLILFRLKSEDLLDRRKSEDLIDIP